MSTATDRSLAAVRSDRPWHEALAYSSPEELARRLAGRVEAAVAAGESVLAVLQDAGRQRLHQELGPAAGGVEFSSPAEVHTVPGFTTAVRWARRSRREDAPASPVFVVAEQLMDLPGCGADYWIRLCLGLQVAGSGLPLTLLCPFRDERANWARVRETHPILNDGHGSAPNPHYRPPREVVREHPPRARPELGPPAAQLQFLATDLGMLRQLTAELGAAGGLEPDRVTDAVLAVNELASNSVEHGAGSGRLRLWAGGSEGLLVEVSDAGRLPDPFPGMVLPDTSGPRGRGLWLASELSDVMEVWADDSGTVVRVSWHS